MDISHITNLLSSLGKNQVTIPITSNDFIETKVNTLYSTIFQQDVFERLDDMNTEIQNYKGNKSKYLKSNKISRNLSNISYESNEDNKLIPKNNNLGQQSETQNEKKVYKNIIHVLACINDSILMFEKNNDKISLFINSYLRSLINFVNEQNIKSVVIDDVKIAKTVIIHQLSNIIESKPFLDNIPTEKLLIHLSSKYLLKHIVLMDNKEQDVYCEFDYTNNDIKDVVKLSKNDTSNEYYLDDVINVDVYKLDYIIKNINEIKLQDNYKENLKSLFVKDLRNIARRLCIDIVDAHTGKLYSKTELRLLIEAKINSI